MDFLSNCSCRVSTLLKAHIGGVHIIYSRSKENGNNRSRAFAVDGDAPSNLILGEICADDAAGSNPIKTVTFSRCIVGSHVSWYCLKFDNS